MKMRLSRKIEKAWLLLGCGVVLYVALLIFFAGRNEAADQKDVQAIAPTDMIASPVQSPALTSILTGPDSDATKWSIIEGPESDKQTRVAYATNYALGTPDPSRIPFTLTVGPVSTPILGFHGYCAQGNNSFSYKGCWTGQLTDGYIFVASGAPHSDLTQGTILVYTRTLDLAFGEGHWYETPTRSGPLTPIQVTWPVLTLATTDDDPPILFAFDLVTRLWLSVPPTPSVLPTALP